MNEYEGIIPSVDKMLSQLLPISKRMVVLLRQFAKDLAQKTEERIGIHCWKMNQTDSFVPGHGVSPVKQKEQK